MPCHFLSWLSPTTQKALKALSTSVGSKFLVALTGLALVGFLIVHLAGNLLILLGADKFNSYSHALISNPLVIPAELGLVATGSSDFHGTNKLTPIAAETTDPDEFARLVGKATGVEVLEG